VIEANNLGSAGLYAADVQKLVDAIEQMKFYLRPVNSSLAQAAITAPRSLTPRARPA
jgi:hypothetical protein